MCVAKLHSQSIYLSTFKQVTKKYNQYKTSVFWLQYFSGSYKEFNCIGDGMELVGSFSG